MIKRDSFVIGAAHMPPNKRNRIQFPIPDDDRVCRLPFWAQDLIHDLQFELHWIRNCERKDCEQKKRKSDHEEAKSLFD